MQITAPRPRLLPRRLGLALALWLALLLGPPQVGSAPSPAAQARSTAGATAAARPAAPRTAQVMGAPSFLATEPFPVDPSLDVRALAWADVDRDGDLDLALAVNGRDRLLLQEAGRFREDERWRPPAGHTEDLAWADVDGDGWPDLATARLDGPNALYRNEDGALASEAAWTDGTADPSHALAWADVDGDDDVDLALANGAGPADGDRRNKIYLNDAGVLASAPAWISADRSDTRDLTWADHDGNGLLDLATANYEEPNRMYRGDGSLPGRVPLESEASWASRTADASVALVFAELMEHGGGIDLAVGNRGEVDKAYPYTEEEGLREYTNAVRWESSDALATSDLAIADVSGDGRPDVIAAGEGLRVYLASRGGINDDAAWSQSEGLADTALAAADFDGDGDVDLAAMGAGLPARLWLNLGLALDDEVDWASPAIWSVPQVTWGDVDGDGDEDMVRHDHLVGDTNWETRLFLNQGGRIDPQPVWRAPERRRGPMAFGDVDGDGRLDLAITDPAEGLVVYRNTGEPSSGFLDSVPVFTADVKLDSSALDWADMDGDGDLDLAEAICGLCRSASTERTRVYENVDGRLVTPPAWVFPSDIKQIHDLAWGDLNEDGYPELAIPSLTGGGITRIYLNEEGRLGDRLLTQLEGGYQQIEIGDMNGDDHLDLIGFAPNIGIQIHLGDGHAVSSFRDVQISPPGESHLAAIAVGDLDADGLLDIVAGLAPDGPNDEAGPVMLWLQRESGFDNGPDWTSADTFDTHIVRLVDVDRDGDLDIYAGNDEDPSGFYLHRGPDMEGPPLLERTLRYEPVLPRPTSLAWGDVDLDGEIDLAVANSTGAGRTELATIHVNTLRGGFVRRFETYSIGSSTEADAAGATDLAWGDVDGDGDIDLALARGSDPLDATPLAAASEVYCNENGTLLPNACWTTADEMDARALAWADVDADGDLDLAIAGAAGRIDLHRNTGSDALLEREPFWTAELGSPLHDLVWGDTDGDGDPDLALAVEGRNALFVNEAGDLGASPAWRSTETITSYALAWADVNGDGGLDLVSANDGRNHVHLNEDGLLQATAGWRSEEVETSRSVAAGSTRGGDLPDLAFGNHLRLDNERGAIHGYAAGESGPGTRATWRARSDDIVLDLAWGDGSQNGLLDLAAVGRSAVQGGDDIGRAVILDAVGEAPTRFDISVRDRPRFSYESHWSSPVSSYTGQVSRALTLAGDHALATMREGIVPVTYTLRQGVIGDRDRVDVHAEYSLSGGGAWHPAVEASGSRTRNAPGVPGVFRWDVLASGLFGWSDQLVLRLSANTGGWLSEHGLPGLFPTPSYRLQTLPFRVRGHQIRVLDEAGAPVTGARVYRLRADEIAGGMPLAGLGGIPYRTDAQGYLVGRSRLEDGDRLLALAPVPLSEELDERFEGRLRLYHTNARPTDTGLDIAPVRLDARDGLHQLFVKAENPLLLFDMDLSLEWDASSTPDVLDSLAADIQSASAHLYDFTNGQVALGRVRVLQNGDGWGQAHAIVRATNRLRPFAAQGGALAEAVRDPDHEDIVYGPGQIVMGAEWNRYGGARDDSFADDWALMLAHELGHYLLFLDDTYLGLDEEDRLIPVTSCTGSAMGDLYGDDANLELVPDGAHWNEACGQTLTARTLGRSEWGTAMRWLPFLRPPARHDENPGPRRMPFALTEVDVRAPLTATASSGVQPIVYLDYEGGARPSSSARAYRLARRGADGEAGGQAWDYAVDVGSPSDTRDGNLLSARGLAPGDRLCVVDSARGQQGCETVREGDERLALRALPGWAPELDVRPVSTSTLALRLAGTLDLPADALLRAQVFPELGPASEIVEMHPRDGAWEAELSLAYPSFAGHVRAWSSTGSGPTEDDREILVGYQLAGNPGPLRGGGPAWRGAGGAQRGGGPAWRGAGAGLRGGGAPVASADGRLIVYTPNPLDLPEGALFAVQERAAPPPLPSGKRAIGATYRIVGTDDAPREIPGSISFQYRGLDLDRERADADELAIHHWDGATWRVLPTRSEARYYLASASSAGQGSYALLAGLTRPRVEGFAPGLVEAGQPLSVTVRGGDFLAPVRVELADRGAPRRLPARLLDAGRLAFDLPADLPPGDYRLRVVNGDGGGATADRRLAVIEPVAACFHDFFESGAMQWELDPPWALVQLPGGPRALTDSPNAPYAGATGAETRVQAATSRPFALDPARCPEPALSLRHAYALSEGDRARIELLNEEGARLEVLVDDIQGYSEDLPLARGASPFGGDPRRGSAPGARLPGFAGPRPLGAVVPEQIGPTTEWTPEELRPLGPVPLGRRTGRVRLRLVLEVDERGSDRGWLVDDLSIHAGGASPPRGRPPRLPFELWLPALQPGG